MSSDETTASVARRHARSGREMLGALLGATIGYAIAMPLPIGDGRDRIPGDLGDARFVHYLLEHLWGWLSGRSLHRALWKLPIFFPSDAPSFLFSDLMIGAAPPYLVARAAGLSPIAAFEVWLFATLVLCYLAMYATCRLLGAGQAGSHVGGFLYAYAASRLHQLVHPQLLASFYPVAALAAFLGSSRLHGSPRPPTGRMGRYALDGLLGACGLLLGLQLWTGYYMGFFALLCGGISGALALAAPRTRRPLLEFARDRRRGIALALGCFFALAIPLALLYKRAEALVGPPSWHAFAVHLVARWWSWLVVGNHSYLYDWTTRLSPVLRDGAWWYELPVGIGVFTTLAGAAGLWLTRRRTSSALLGATALVAALLATRWFGETSPWRLVYRLVPGGEAIRVPARIGLYLPLAAGIGVALLVGRLSRDRRGRVLAGVVAVLVVAEQLGRPITHSRREETATLAAIARRVPDDAEAFAVARRGHAVPEYVLQLDAVWAAELAGVPTVNGYSGSWAPGWPDALWRAEVPARRRIAAFRGAVRGWVLAEGGDPDRVAVVVAPRSYRSGGESPVAIRRPHRRPPAAFSAPSHRVSATTWRVRRPRSRSGDALRAE